MVMNLPISQDRYEDFVKTVEALLEESQEDKRILSQALKRKDSEIEEKMELISCLKGEKPGELEVTEGHREEDSLSLDMQMDGSFSVHEMRLKEKFDEVGRIKSHIQFYSRKLTSLEEKASKIVSLGDMTVEILKKHIERLNHELRLRDEIIAELKLKETGKGLVAREITEESGEPEAGQPGE
jgi:tRNA pseudouridine-54 N-methylase